MLLWINPGGGWRRAAAQAGFMFPGLGYEAVPWYDQFGEFASKNPGGLAQVGEFLLLLMVYRERLRDLLKFQNEKWPDDAKGAFGMMGGMANPL